MPIVVSYEPGQLIGDLASNAGQFAANRQLQDMALKQQAQQLDQQRAALAAEHQSFEEQYQPYAAALQMGNANQQAQLNREQQTANLKQVYTRQTDVASIGADARDSVALTRAGAQRDVAGLKYDTTEDQINANLAVQMKRTDLLGNKAALDAWAAQTKLQLQQQGLWQGDQHFQQAQAQLTTAQQQHMQAQQQEASLRQQDAQLAAEERDTMQQFQIKSSQATMLDSNGRYDDATKARGEAQAAMDRNKDVVGRRKNLQAGTVAQDAQRGVVAPPQMRQQMQSLGQPSPFQPAGQQPPQGAPHQRPVPNADVLRAAVQRIHSYYPAGTDPQFMFNATKKLLRDNGYDESQLSY